MSRGAKSRAELETASLRIRLQAAEFALDEAKALILDLNAQIDAANAAAVRMARWVRLATKGRAA